MDWMKIKGFLHWLNICISPSLVNRNSIKTENISFEAIPIQKKHLPLHQITWTNPTKLITQIWRVCDKIVVINRSSIDHFDQHMLIQLIKFENRTDKNEIETVIYERHQI